MKDKTKHRYLVGYVGDYQCVFGKEGRWIRAMDFKKANQVIKMFTCDFPKRIYKLVPVRTLK